MVEFAYNNIKNVNTGHTSFELDCRYHACISFKNDTYFCSRFCTVKTLAKKLRDLMYICQHNQLYTQKIYKQANDKGVELQSYASGKKI